MTPHRILLSYHRELRFDVHDGEIRAAYYEPTAERAYLRRLAIQASRGSLDAERAIRALDRRRTTGRGGSLAECLRMARGLKNLDRECLQVQEYAEYMGWLSDVTATADGDGGGDPHVAQRTRGRRWP